MYDEHDKLVQGLEQACEEARASLPKGYSLSILYCRDVIGVGPVGVKAHCKQVIAPLGGQDLEAWNEYWENMANQHESKYRPIRYEHGAARHGHEYDIASSSGIPTSCIIFYKVLGELGDVTSEQIRNAAKSLADLTKKYAEAVELDARIENLDWSK